MSTRSSLSYIEYKRKGGSLHIYFEMMDCKYCIQDEEGGLVELPKHIAKAFAEVLENSPEGKKQRKDFEKKIKENIRKGKEK